jgi:CheY-like chemotaxis protein
MTTPLVCLIHWNAAEAAGRAAALARAGFRVQSRPIDPGALKAIRAHPPDAFVIDLTRLPSHGREIALVLRTARATRHVPIVFAEGEAEKVARIRALLPDAAYTSWGRMRGALKTALARPPAVPVVPSSIFAGYSGTPLPKKLGIKAGFVVALHDAPDGFEGTLGPLPGDVVCVHNPRGARDLTLWFVRNRRALDARMTAMAKAGAGGLWIIWPKRASALASDLGEPDVRAAGLAAGLVDFKVCAVDDTWSGLKFVERRRPGS